MNHSDEFLRLITEFQGRLRAYILSLLGDRNHVDEVLQETNYQIWRLSDEYEPGTNFKAWTFRIAHFQVMSFRQKRLRDHLFFCSETIEKLSIEASDLDQGFADKKQYLEECMQKLSGTHRRILMQHYGENRSLADIGAEIGKSANTVGQLLFRIRKALVKCFSVKERDSHGVR